MQAVVDSLLTTYGRHGKPTGRAVLILHGWGDNSQGWQAFAAGLAGQYCVYVVDLPGFGKSDAPAKPWGLDEYAAFVSHFLKKIDVKPYAIVAHSNGGAIAIRGLAEGLLEAERLVLLASAGVRSEYKGRKRVLRMAAKTGKILAMPLPAAVKDKLRRKLYTTVGSDMLVAEHLQETFKKVVSDDVQNDAAKLALPTLLVYGEDDVSTPPAFGRLLHGQIAGSTLEIFGNAGHFVHIDQPAKTTAAVKDFLS